MRVSLDEAVARLVAGGLVAYPTETVYGLGCDVRSPAALDALMERKGRSAERGFSVLVAGLPQLEDWIGAVSERARALAERFWPGPLTLVLPEAAAAFPAVATPRGVGFRCSSHPVALELARRCPCPIASTSCNRTGRPPARSPDEVEKDLGDDLPVLATEPVEESAPSTVVWVPADGPLELLREGALAFAHVTAALASPRARARST